MLRYVKLLDYQRFWFLIPCLYVSCSCAMNCAESEVSSNDLKRLAVEKERQVRTLQDITLPRIKNTKTQGNYASYDIEPLEAGYGMTLDNALRRVLLSSLPGAAVTSIRIDSVRNEFQDNPHVMVAGNEAGLNVKKLRT